MRGGLEEGRGIFWDGTQTQALTEEGDSVRDSFTSWSLRLGGRGDRTRTCDITLPKRAL